MKAKCHLIRRILRPGVRGQAILLFTMLLLGCSTMNVEPLMPTPLMYHLGEQGPTDHVPEEERWNRRQVFYFTTRERDPDLRKIVYGNEESEEVSIGVSLIGFGGYDLTWSDLRDVSVDADRAQDVPLSIAGVMEVGRLDVAEKGKILEVRALPGG